MKVRKISIFSKLFCGLALLLLISNGILGLLTYRSSKQALFEQIQNNAINIAQCAAANISTEIWQNIREGQEHTPEYEQIIHELELFRDHAEIEYIYTLRQTGENEFAFVVDSDPEEPAAIGEACEPSPALITAFREQTSCADDSPLIDEWGSHVSAYSPILHNGSTIGAVGVDISALWIDLQTKQLRSLVFGTCTVTYTVCLILLHFLISGLKKSMKKLNDKVKELAGGSGDLTKEIDITTGDELEVIAGNMNIFIRQIRSLIRDVAHSSTSIRDTGHELDDTVRDNIHIMAEMKKEIETISCSMEQSSASSQNLSHSLTENADHIAAFADHITGIRDMVQQANDHAQETAQAVNENRKHALYSISTLQQKMEQVQQDTRKIQMVEKIADDIGTIASQTRLLSLNAQIEAARAGQAGAGFAVVATEVEHLSNDIDRSVSEINQITSQVLEAVRIMSEVSGEMIRFVSEDVVRDYDAFAGLGEEYGNTTDYICREMVGIGNQSTQISQDISHMNTNIQSIARTVTAAAENADTLVASTMEISSSLEKLHAVSHKNSTQSEKLNDHVEKYRY